ALAADAARAAEQTADAARTRAMSQRDAEQYQANAEAAAATVKSNEAIVETARLNLEYCQIKAPFDGRTGKAMVKAGTVVEANKTDLVELNQITPIGVGFAVPERMLPAIRAGQAERGGVTTADSTTTVSAGLAITASAPGDTGGTVGGVLTFIDN